VGVRSLLGAMVVAPLLLKGSVRAALGDPARRRPLLLGGLDLPPRLSANNERDYRRDQPKGANQRHYGHLAHEDLCSTAARRGFLISVLQIYRAHGTGDCHAAPRQTEAQSDLS
jgi:hypothetical protein